MRRFIIICLEPSFSHGYANFLFDLSIYCYGPQNSILKYSPGPPGKSRLGPINLTQIRRTISDPNHLISGRISLRVRWVYPYYKPVFFFYIYKTNKPNDLNKIFIWPASKNVLPKKVRYASKRVSRCGPLAQNVWTLGLRKIQTKNELEL